MSGFHRDIKGEQNHVIHAGEFADKAEREAATGFDASHLYKIALQLSDNTYWSLVNVNPVEWEPVGNKEGLQAANQSIDNVTQHVTTLTEAVSNLGTQISLTKITTSQDWIKPLDLKMAIVFAAGGGGGAGSAYGGRAGKSGGSGGSNAMLFLPDELPSAVSVTVGAGGAGSTIFGKSGSNGENTIFHTLTCYGGKGGANGNGSNGASGGVVGGILPHSYSAGNAWYNPLLGGRGGTGNMSSRGGKGQNGSVWIWEVC